MGIEAAVRSHRELSAGSRGSDPPDRLGEEVGGSADRVRPAFAQARHEHVAGPGGDREQGVVAPDPGVPVVGGTLLRQAVRLADRRVEIDREGCRSGSGPGCPGPPEELPADPVELADVTPAEAAQERPERGSGLHRDPEDPARAAGAQGVRVVDRVAAREGGHDKRQELVPGVRPTGRGAEVEVLIHELLETEMLGQGGRQEQPRVRHQAVVVEGRFQAVEAVG